MDFPVEYMSNVYTIPIENIGPYDEGRMTWRSSSARSPSGDKTVLERVQQAKKVNEEGDQKSLQASIRRQRRFDGLQLLEKTKLHR